MRNDGASLGLYYARQRFFDSSLGRWLTPDPIGFSGGLNLYTAMANEPTRYVDPEGMNPILAGLAAAFAFEAYNEASGNNARAIDANLIPVVGPNRGRTIWLSKGCPSDRSNIVAGLAPTRFPGLASSASGGALQPSFRLAAGMAGDDVAMKAFMETLPNQTSGRALFVTHSTKFSPVAVVRINGQNIPLTAEKVAAKMAAQGIRDGQESIMVACYAGSNGMAQGVARARGARTWGYTKTLGTRSGKYWEEPGGKWLPFDP